MAVKIPYHPDAEDAIIAACTLWPDKVADLAAELEPEDFYVPRNRALFAAFLDIYERQGIKPDIVSLASVAQVDPADVLTIQTNCVGVTPKHVELVREARVGRDLLVACRAALNNVTSGGDAFESLDELNAFIRGVGSTSSQPQAMTLEELLAQGQTTAPWVVPGLLRQDMRAIVVGFEGCGKGTLLRAICMCAAQGVHPLTPYHGKFHPQRALLLDAENPIGAIEETGEVLRRTLAGRLGIDYDPERFKIWHKLDGVDLRRRSIRADFQREIAAHRPTLVAIGPLYKLYSRKSGEAYEQAAEDILHILDELRVRYGFALMIEHHSPKGDHVKRDLVPFGSQFFQAWPDIGIGLRPDEKWDQRLTIEHYRGARMKVNWPQAIVRDPVWLWRGEYKMSGEDTTSLEEDSE